MKETIFTVFAFAIWLAALLMIGGGMRDETKQRVFWCIPVA